MRILIGMILFAMSPPVLAQTPAPKTDPVDAVFAPLGGATSPGCVVGVSRDGQPLLTRAYGTADLEHAVPITPATIFEAGSVSKQFTAAAILQLVEEGKLSLSDDVRTFVPELPDYGATITIDHLLNHTNGLRDWGSVMDVAGWPRSTRANTQGDALAIIVRQRELNHATGAEYSYTNSGYNLAAIIVQRVSGLTLADYTKQRFFEPLGMRSTSWRDNFRRIVPGRAIAYAPAAGGFEQLMPFEDAYGNGGLLTTVQDLLIWNEALSKGRLGARVTQRLTERASLANGHRVSYARGLIVQDYRGTAEISHGGSTGGYRAWLGRYPDARLSVALLCNTASASHVALAHAVADQFLPEPPKPASATAPMLSADMTGTFVNGRTGMPVRLMIEKDKLRIDGGLVFDGVAPGQFRSGQTDLRFVDANRFTLRTVDTQDVPHQRAEPFAPDANSLQTYAGQYISDEANAGYVVTVKDGRLLASLTERPQEKIALDPVYPDAFTGDGGLFKFRKDVAGKVVTLGIGSPRARDIKFARQPDTNAR